LFYNTKNGDAYLRYASPNTFEGAVPVTNSIVILKVRILFLTSIEEWVFAGCGKGYAHGHDTSF